MRILLAILVAVLTLSLNAEEVDLSTPKSAAKGLLTAVAAEDAGAVRQYLWLQDESQESLAGTFAELLIATQQLADAAGSKFGPAGEAIGKGAVTSDQLQALETAEVTESDGKATILLPGQPRPMTWIKIDGQWRWAFVDYAGVDPANLTAQTAMLKSVAKAMSEVASEINTGKYPTAAEAEQAIQQRLHQTMVESLKSNPPTTRGRG